MKTWYFITSAQHLSLIAHRICPIWKPYIVSYLPNMKASYHVASTQYESLISCRICPIWKSHIMSYLPNMKDSHFISAQYESITSCHICPIWKPHFTSNLSNTNTNTASSDTLPLFTSIDTTGPSPTWPSWCAKQLYTIYRVGEPTVEGQALPARTARDEERWLKAGWVFVAAYRQMAEAG